MTSRMSEPLRTSNRLTALEDLVSVLSGDLRDALDRLRALEKRLDRDDAIRDKLREIADPSVCGIPGTNVSVSILGDQRIGVSIPVAK